jgi:hypothetical protein
MSPSKDVPDMISVGWSHCMDDGDSGKVIVTDMLQRKKRRSAERENTPSDRNSEEA